MLIVSRLGNVMTHNILLLSVLMFTHRARIVMKVFLTLWLLELAALYYDVGQMWFSVMFFIFVIDTISGENLWLIGRNDGRGLIAGIDRHRSFA